MTVEQALQLAVTTGPGLPRLERLDAGMLLLHALGRDPHERAWLLAHGTDELAPSALQNFQSLCAQRQDGMPMAYLLGRTEFYGLPLTITPEVLDPRDDTETLVDWALSLMPPMPRWRWSTWAQAVARLPWRCGMNDPPPRSGR